MCSRYGPRKIGRGNLTTNRIAQPHDIIDLFHLDPQGIFQKAAPLYASGASLREISKELGICKTTLSKTLTEGGVDLRSANGGPRQKSIQSVRRHIGVAPYGYCVIRGKLVEVPKEQEVIRLVFKLRSESRTLTAIADHLNRHKLKPRSAKRWDHSTVNSILKRNAKQTTKEV